MIENLPVNAEDTGSIPHVAEQPSLRAIATEACLPRALALRWREATAMRSWSITVMCSPHLL